MRKRGIKKIMFLLLASITAISLLILAVIFTSSGVFTASKYLEPWTPGYSQQFDDPRIQLAAHGLLSANGHNLQPWHIRLDKEDPKVFYLYADSRRLAREVDPWARQTMISQGTFLEYVRVAGEKLGYSTAIELFPEGDYDEKNLTGSMDSKPVAKIILTKTTPLNSPLYSYMFLPDTNRNAYLDARLTNEQVSQIAGISGVGDITMTIRVYQDTKDIRKLENYVLEGANIESRVHRINEESAAIFRANEFQKNKYRYGFSLEGQGTSGFMKHIMQGLITIVPSINSEKASADLFVQSTRTAIEHTPAYAMIISKGNSREEQVGAGMLYSRLVLTAHEMGLVMQPVSQVLEEYPEMNEQYSSIHSEYAMMGTTIQMFLRLGQPAKDTPLTMRRDVMDVIIR
ncbi:Acg family FMN-binding oxidoreductase [Paenibacillus sp. sgz500958]|uniref:Acg family FMN-binding oxidoreductase n=1 Tax=Paenibacillus sp. sgz500958 TaxID=3242475 RepID=UPI0036D2E445